MPWRRFSAPIVPLEHTELVRITQRLLADRPDVVDRKTLLASGMTVGELNHARRSKRLADVHAGVYARGRRELGRDGRFWAAIAACGPGSVEGGLAAGVRYGMVEPDAYELAITTTSGARPYGVDVHRVAQPPAGMLLDGVPILMPHAVLIELASILTPPQLARALAEAEVLRLVDHERLIEELDGRRRVRPLQELLADGPLRTRSPVEDEVLPLIASAGLPAPERNVRLLGWNVDFLWREAKVVLEIDSWTYHATASHYERDARKDADLALAGVAVIRATRGQVRREPAKLVARLAAKVLSSS
jgi:hypothetical protein